MGKKPNAMLAAYEAKLERQYLHKLNIALQMAEDACLIATSEVRGLGPDNAELLRIEFRRTVNSICHLLAEDGKDDPDTEWSRAKVDQRLAEIEGDKARDWDARMAWTWIGERSTNAK